MFPNSRPPYGAALLFIINFHRSFNILYRKDFSVPKLVLHVFRNKHNLWQLLVSFCETVHLRGMEDMGIFSERYRVVAVDPQSITLRGVRSGEVLKIVNADPSHPLSEKDYPPGKLIALGDPSTDVTN